MFMVLSYTCLGFWSVTSSNLYIGLWLRAIRSLVWLVCNTLSPHPAHPAGGAEDCFVHVCRGYSQPSQPRVAVLTMFIIRPSPLYVHDQSFAFSLVGSQLPGHVDGPIVVAWTGSWHDFAACSSTSRAFRSTWLVVCGLCETLHVDHLPSMRLSTSTCGWMDHSATALSLCLPCAMAHSQRIDLDLRLDGRFFWCPQCRAWFWHTSIRWHQGLHWRQ